MPRKKAEQLKPVEKQELHCHNCDKYVQFDIDINLDGPHVIICPNCGHDHYRVVNKGIITGDRWGQSQSQQQIYQATNVSFTTSSTTTATGTDSFLRSSWLNSTSGSALASNSTSTGNYYSVSSTT